ncbi:hypothetical protein [Kutzneria sp. NPDC051319]|uniref:hypothetical protein n=1 Tax=Kutzneria sp. NPDC051319 TaxID=3155047 RepID=UPI003445B3A6
MPLDHLGGGVPVEGVAAAAGSSRESDMGPGRPEGQARPSGVPSNEKAYQGGPDRVLMPVLFPLVTKALHEQCH